jgi:hypothetical protein
MHGSDVLNAYMWESGVQRLWDVYTVDKTWLLPG